MRPRIFSTWRAPGSVSMAAMGATPPRARLLRLSQRLARALSPKSFAGQCQETRHAIEPVRFEAGQTSAAAALQAARGRDRARRPVLSESGPKPASAHPGRRAESLRESLPGGHGHSTGTAPERVSRPTAAARLAVHLPFVIYCSDKWQPRAMSPQNVGASVPLVQAGAGGTER